MTRSFSRPRATRVALAMLMGVIGATACGVTLPPVTWPSAATEPATDAVNAWDRATAACRAASTFSAQLHLTGRVGSAGRRVSGSLQLALSRRDEIFLALNEPLGAPGFVLSGTGEQATLVLPRGDKRVLVAPAADIIEALTGLRLGPRELMALTTGCVVSAGSATTGERSGDSRVVAIDGAQIWARQSAGGWQTFAGARGGLIVNYRAYMGSWPSEISVAAAHDAPTPLQLLLRFEQIVPDSPRVDGQTFTPHPPADATPMTLDELRRMGPLGEKSA